MTGSESAEGEPPFPLTAVDKWVLSQTDDEFQLHTWDELKEIITANRLEVLKRRPSDLRRYMSWTRDIKIEYGSMTNFIIRNKLPWGSPPYTHNSPVPFADPSDYKILVNDWPYGLTPDLTHIVVWSKTPIPTDERSGDVTEESRNLIENFVKKMFAERLGEDRAIWFKNWVQLQSVRTLEHIHVIVRDASKNDLDFLTGTKEECI